MTVYPIPNGADSAADREHSTALYRGILSQEPIEPTDEWNRIRPQQGKDGNADNLTLRQGV